MNQFSFFDEQMNWCVLRDKSMKSVKMTINRWTKRVSSISTDARSIYNRYQSNQIYRFFRFIDWLIDTDFYRLTSLGSKSSIRCIRRRPHGPFSKEGRERILGTRLVCIIITCVNNATKTFQFHVSTNAAESSWVQKGMSVSYFSWLGDSADLACCKKAIKNCTKN